MAIRIDAHMDIPWLMTKAREPNGNTFNYTTGHPSSIFTIDKAKEGGLTAAIFALYLSDAWQDIHTDEEIQAELNKQRYGLYLNGAFVADSLSQFRQYQADYHDLFYVLMGLEGGRLIQNSLYKLSEWAELGILYLTLTHNRNTMWAGSATDQPTANGLTAFGRSVVKKCNYRRVLVDVSHSADNTVLAALEASTKPIAATHSGCRALVKQPRNLPDHLIKKIAQTKGIVCVPYVKKFMGCYTPAKHIQHIVDLVGIDYVGIGSDIDGATLVTGFNCVSQWRSQVEEELLDAGYSSEAMDKIMGGNLLRVLEAA